MENNVNKKYFSTQGAKHTTYGVVKEERIDECVCAIIKRAHNDFKTLYTSETEVIPTSIINHASQISQSEFEEQWI